MNRAKSLLVLCEDDLDDQRRKQADQRFYYFSS